MVLKRVRECVACKLAALISTQYGMCVPMGDRIFHCLAAKFNTMVLDSFQVSTLRLH